MKFLERELIDLEVEVQSAEEAIRAAGSLLVSGGAADASYVEAMVQAYRDKGPYFVLAPHIALPHAKAEDGVHEASVAFVRLKQPVVFGHQTNDPVDLVFALGSASNADHIALLRRLTLILNDPNHVQCFREARSPEDIENIILRRNEA
ncbi:PTS sugar transporter subunit IIA [Paenibacillus tyrfis]|uniref:PTS sugar transporter subunit IIA n=1 Tax=Paenibacillus tyrfis TaxID=1501230 RepID=UPI0020A0077C|nr:PTS sugar transporter subunit IIA [Paenibacillus tyrfis]MCP1310738.1 PTS sugar transporter subunit IIA [Paenibacillus tyrfis]